MVCLKRRAIRFKIKKIVKGKEIRLAPVTGNGRLGRKKRKLKIMAAGFRKKQPV